MKSADRGLLPLSYSREVSRSFDEGWFTVTFTATVTVTVNGGYASSMNVTLHQGGVDLQQGPWTDTVSTSGDIHNDLNIAEQDYFVQAYAGDSGIGVQKTLSSQISLPDDVGTVNVSLQVQVEPNPQDGDSGGDSLKPTPAEATAAVVSAAVGGAAYAFYQWLTSPAGAGALAG